MVRTLFSESVCPFERIRGEASDLEFFIAILLCYLMMCSKLVASQSIQFELISEIHHMQVSDSGSSDHEMQHV